MKSRVFALVVAGSLAYTFAPIRDAAARQSAEPKPARAETVISSDGTAKVTRTPDYLDVTIGIESEANAALEAQSASGSVMTRALDAVRALALKDVDIRPGRAQLVPRYSERADRGQPERRIIGYTATLIIRVRTSDLAAGGRIIDAALAAGVNRIESVEFGSHGIIEAREEAIRLATQAAKRKAAVMAEALGLRITRVATVNAQPGSYSSWAQNSAAQLNSAPSGQSGDDASTPVVPGQIEVWATVSVTFAAEGIR
ncbi:MAG: SIMPL domain-containing protein [Phycisphaerae bacterium]|nr:SIMPL domain-containing protein [Phycisphaerae bacterium]